MPDKKTFAKKSFGQNFLVDENYIDKIISASNPKTGETIIEIGAGRGALTEKLIESGANIIAVELERDMIAVLKERFDRFENFQLIESDALKIDFSELINQIPEHKVKLVANLPYYISTAILQKLIEQREVFSEMILMFQREVVERITAYAGNKERGFLTVLTEAYLNAEKLFDVPPNAFRPAPRIRSAVVKLTPKFDVGIADDDLFRTLISSAFKQKRKTLWNNLSHFAPKNNFNADKWNEVFSDSQILPERRAETLTIEEWKKLADTII